MYSVHCITTKNNVSILKNKLHRDLQTVYTVLYIPLNIYFNILITAKTEVK